MPMFFLAGCPLASIASTVIYAFSTADLFGKAIVLLLLGGSIFAWSIMITKTREFRRAAAENRRFLAAYRREENPLALRIQSRKYGGPLAVIYAQASGGVLSEAGEKTTALELTLNHPSGAPRLQVGPFEINTVRKLAERSAMDQGFFLEEDMGLLATAVTGAPFLGLLGTVWGVMDSFRAMAASGTVMLSEVAPGISGALLTTVVGLIVALPSLIGYNLLTNQIRRLCMEMDNFSEEFTHDMERYFLQPPKER